MNINLNSRKRILEIFSTISVIILWEITARIINDNIILPRFTVVLINFFELIQGKELYLDILTSLTFFIIGLGAALIIGMPIGIFMGWFKSVDKSIDPVIEMLRPIPPLA